MTDHPYAPFIALMDAAASKPDEPDIDLRDPVREDRPLAATERE